MSKNISRAAISLLAATSLEAKGQQINSITLMLDQMELDVNQNNKSSIISRYNKDLCTQHAKLYSKYGKAYA